MRFAARTGTRNRVLDEKAHSQSLGSLVEKERLIFSSQKQALNAPFPRRAMIFTP